MSTPSALGLQSYLLKGWVPGVSSHTEPEEVRLEPKRVLRNLVSTHPAQDATRTSTVHLVRFDLLSRGISSTYILLARAV